MDARTKSVAEAFLAFQPEPEDIADPAVKQARENSAERQAEIFIAMLTAATANDKAS